MWDIQPALGWGIPKLIFGGLLNEQHEGYSNTSSCYGFSLSIFIRYSNFGI